MSAVAEIQGRIAEIQGAIQTLRTGVAATAGSSTSAASAASGTAFADALAAARAGSADAVTGTGSSTSFAPTAALGSTTTPALTTAGSLGTAGTGQGLVDAAQKYIGVPYVWGGTNPATGLDCSGFVQRAMADIGVSVPRVAKDQGRLGTAVSSLAVAEPGDLLVFGGGSHIGIYVGDGTMIDEPKPGKSVSVRDVFETPTAIRRVLPTASAAPAVPAPAAAPAPTSAADLQRYALTMMSEAVAA